MAVFAKAKPTENKGLTVTDRSAPVCERCHEGCRTPKRVGQAYWCKRCVKAARALQA